MLEKTQQGKRLREVLEGEIRKERRGMLKKTQKEKRLKERGMLGEKIQPGKEVRMLAEKS